MLDKVKNNCQKQKLPTLKPDPPSKITIILLANFKQKKELNITIQKINTFEPNSNVLCKWTVSYNIR